MKLSYYLKVKIEMLGQLIPKYNNDLVREHLHTLAFQVKSYRLFKFAEWLKQKSMLDFTKQDKQLIGDTLYQIACDMFNKEKWERHLCK